MNVDKIIKNRCDWVGSNPLMIAYHWKFVGEKPIMRNIKLMKDIPATTTESDAMSKDLIKKGFKFVGSTICFAFMQAVGMVNDHQAKCFRYNISKSRYL